MPGDQPALEHERLELAACRDRVDPCDRCDEILHLLALVAVEVGPHARAQVLRFADVEDLIVPVAEHVDAGGARKVVRERDLREVRPAARAARMVELAERADAEVMADVEQPLEDLAGRLGVLQGAVGWLDARAEVARERPQPHVGHLRPHEPARELRGAHRRAGQRRVLEPQEVRIEEAHVERRVVRDDHRSPRELQERRQDRRERGRAGDGAIADPGEVRDGGRDRPFRVDERLERPDALGPFEPHGADLGDGVVDRRAAGGLEVDDHERDLLERDRLAEHGLHGLAQDERRCGGGGQVTTISNMCSMVEHR